MGLILDTSTLVAGERRGHNVADILAQVREAHGETEIGISAVTIAELAHGIQRAKLDVHRHKHRTFFEDIKRSIAVYPLTVEIAERAGEISGQQAESGINLPFEDLLIGATALQLGFAVLTGNVRHFEMIPGLTVKRL